MQPIKLQLTSIRHWWKSIQLLILAVLLALSLLGVAIAQDSFHRKPIQVTAAIPRNFPSQYLLDEKGKPTGFAIDVMEQVAALAGLQVTYQVGATWHDVIEALRQGKVDLIPNLGITPQRQADFAFTTPVETFPVSIFVRQPEQAIQKIEDLPGNRVAVVKQNAAFYLLQDREDIELQVFETPEKALFHLLAGEVEALVYPEPVLLKIARTVGVEERIKVVGQPLIEIKRAIAVQKDNGALLERLNQAVTSLVDSSAYQQLYVKWYGYSDPHIPIIWMLVGLLLLLLTAVVAWRYYSQHRLNRLQQTGEALQRANQELSQTKVALEKLNQELETRVQQRTAALAQANAQLQEEIAERKQAEKALRESQAHYATLTEAVPVGIFHTDTQGNYLYANERCCEMTGLTSEETLGRGWTRTLHPDDRERTWNEWYRCVQENLLFQSEYRFEHADGKTVWVFGQAVPERDPTGKVTGYIGSITEISDRKKALEALRQNEERLQLVIDAANNAIWDWDIEHNTVFRSERVYEFLGLSSTTTEQGYETIYQRIHPEDRERFAQAIQDHLKYNHPYQVELRIQRADGSYGWFTDRGKAIRDANGQPIRLVGSMSDISDRKRAEAKIQQNRNFLQTLIDHLPVALFVKDGKEERFGQLLLVNKTCEKIFGLTAEQAVGKTGHDLFPKEQADFYEQKDREAFARGVLEDIPEEPIDSYSLGRRILHTIKVPLYDQNCQPQYLLCISEDITEGKQAEKALRESQERLQAIIDNTSTVIYLKDCQGRYLLINRQHENLFNLSKNQMIGKTDAEIFPAEIAAAFRSNDRKVLAAEMPLEFEETVPQDDGIHTYISIKFPLWDSGGKAYGICGISTDITQRKRTEAEITALNRLLHSISDAQSQFIAEVKPHLLFDGLLDSLLELTDSEYGFIGEILYKLNGEPYLEEGYMKMGGQPYLETHAITNIAWNEATRAFYEKYAPAGMEFDNLKTLFDAVIVKGEPVIANSLFTDSQPGDLPEGHPPLNAFLGLPFYSDRKLVGMVGIANRPDGYDRALVNYLQPFLATCANIIQAHSNDKRRQQAEEEIRRLNENLEQRVAERTAQLEAINKELDSFSYSVSHDLRAPLRHINGFVNALKQRLESSGTLNDSKAVHYLQVIQDSSQKMGQLIDGLLTLSRLGRRQLVPSSVDLRQLVETAIDLVNPSTETAQEPKIEFKIGNLPPVRGDRILLQQVFNNLIDNAVKFSRDRRPAKIEICCLPDGTIFVKDNGAGFQMEYADQLFSAFGRLHSKQEFEGTGIGLSIVQRIIHRHGGKIWAKSEPDRGATFYFQLGQIERGTESGRS